jgi:cobalamin biosynthesis protein CobW
MTKIPATVVTGFLGAGKTSLIRHLLENAGGRRIALIVNEFGDLGVDGEILRGCGIEACGDGDIVELANGCICCTVADDFLPTMAALLDRPQPPDHIVIETSGLALPKPLVQAFNWPDVRTRVTVDGVIAVLDGPAVRDGLFADDPDAVNAQRRADDNLDHDSPLHELYEDQVACADLLVLNKCDQLTEAERAALAASLDGRRVLHASHGRLDPRVLLGLGAAAEDDVANRRSHHDGEADHDHDEFASFVVDIGAVATPADLLARLEAAAASLPILRVKGFVPVAGKDMRLLVQGVGRRFQHYFDRAWRDGEARDGRLVVIGTDDLDEAAVRAALGASPA